MPLVRGLLHVHSTLSDGVLTPVQLRDLARASGYRFVVLCEHTKWLTTDKRAAAIEECRQLSDVGFLCLLGLECSYEGRHVLLLGPADLLIQAEDETAVLHPESLRDAGGLTIWAHPAATSFWTLRRGIAADYDGWEVWNQYADGPIPSFPTLKLLRRERLRGRNLLALGGTDFHRPARHGFFPTLIMQLPELSGPAVMEALRTGAFRTARDAVSAPSIDSAGEHGRPMPPDALYAAVRFGLLRIRSVGVYLQHVRRGLSAEEMEDAQD